MNIPYWLLGSTPASEQKASPWKCDRKRLRAYPGGALAGHYSGRRISINEGEQIVVVGRRDLIVLICLKED